MHKGYILLCIVLVGTSSSTSFRVTSIIGICSSLSVVAQINCRRFEPGDINQYRKEVKCFAGSVRNDRGGMEIGHG